MARESGILLPMFSLPSEYGIGGFGKECYDFIDFLAESGQSVWQILPLVQTGYGDSPYSSVCSTSFNPFFISLEKLVEKGLLKSYEIEDLKSNEKYINYGELYNNVYPILKLAFSRFDVETADFREFIKKGEYDDYALFMSIRENSGYKPFYEWESGLKYRNRYSLDEYKKTHIDQINFWLFLQFEARSEWLNVKSYANLRGIKILGDIPLYVAADSVDVWTNPRLFKLNSDLTSIKIAGVPPDYFSKTGQLWGNPVYDYEKHAEDGFLWWINRIKGVLDIFDLVRIDHFRGFDRFYEVDSGMSDATVGEWVSVPSKELFDRIHEQIDNKRIIAEDLGIIDDGVRDLLKYTGYPGMKILSFAFNGEPDNLYLPEHIEENSVVYTGTHDNDTLFGMISSASDWDKANLVRGVKNSLSLSKIDMEINSDQDLADAIVELGASSKSRLFIVPLFDYMYKKSDYRINEPGTVKSQNWAVRSEKSNFSPILCEKIKKLTEKYGRK